MTRRYFKLQDEVAEGRWRVGEVHDATGAIPRLIRGRRIETPVAYCARVTHEGALLEYFVTSFNVPVATETLAKAIAEVAPGNVQVLPLEIIGHGHWSILNVTEVVDCLDERRATFTKWTEADGRPDRMGGYKMVLGLVVDVARVPMQTHCFRVAGWEVALIVSDDVKSAMLRIGCQGAQFVEVTPTP